VSLVVFSGCSSLKDQAKSRELLAKCEYTLEDVAVENISFTQVIELIETAKEVDWKDPDPEILPLLNEIRKLNFELDFQELDFQAAIGIYNPNDHEVVVDSLYFDAFLDESKIARVHHNTSMLISPNSNSVIETTMTVAKGIKLKKVRKAEEIQLRGKVWLKIELLKDYPVTLPMKFDVSRPVPREEINALIDEQKRIVVAKIVKELLSGGIRNLFDQR
ncbi:MAG: hypothetical protein HKN32_05095, partial [Flavobacteriales bacterium]|nr:hypothetical protein [Flavobacteriales bacterium]